MTPSVYKRIVFLNSDCQSHDWLRQLFGNLPDLHDICFADTPEEVVKHTAPRSIPQRSKSRKCIELTVVVCSNSYLHFLENYDGLRGELLYAPIVLYDSHPRHGCAHMADMLHFQGYCTRHDGPDDLFECVSSVFNGTPAMTSHGRELLEVDHNSGKLCAHNMAKGLKLFLLNHREWSCFRHFIVGGMEAVLENHSTLEKGSLANVMGNLRRKLGVKRNNELIPLARNWGYVT